MASRSSEIRRSNPLPIMKTEKNMSYFSQIFLLVNHLKWYKHKKHDSNVSKCFYLLIILPDTNRKKHASFDCDFVGFFFY
jgi:hypothetical protein